MGLQVNYYIVVPSSDNYAELLNAPATLCGVIIGSMPLAALVSALVYSWWSNYSYRAPLIWSTLILMAGNLMYATALYFNSVWLLLIGRFLCGWVHTLSLSAHSLKLLSIIGNPSPSS
jgi:predicted MFS family arabinose efflux permease